MSHVQLPCCCPKSMTRSTDRGVQPPWAPHLVTTEVFFPQRCFTHHCASCRTNDCHKTALSSLYGDLIQHFKYQEKVNGNPSPSGFRQLPGEPHQKWPTQEQNLTLWHIKSRPYFKMVFVCAGVVEEEVYRCVLRVVGVSLLDGIVSPFSQ